MSDTHYIVFSYEACLNNERACDSEEDALLLASLLASVKERTYLVAKVVHEIPPKSDSRQRNYPFEDDYEDK